MKILEKKGAVSNIHVSFRRCKLDELVSVNDLLKKVLDLFNATSIMGTSESLTHHHLAPCESVLLQVAESVHEKTRKTQPTTATFFQGLSVIYVERRALFLVDGKIDLTILYLPYLAGCCKSTGVEVFCCVVGRHYRCFQIMSTFLPGYTAPEN